MVAPVTKGRIAIAAKTLANADVAAVACRKAGLPFYSACALLEKESGGKNIYGNDKGGVLSGFPGEVNADNFAAFRWEVVERGRTSNGVGPAQITYRGFFVDMAKQGLRPWVPADNMLYGFRLLKAHYDAGGSWIAAGELYNGARTYGIDLSKKVDEWKQRLGISK